MTDPLSNDRQEQAFFGCSRERARLGRTVAALLSRGFDSETAKRIEDEGLSLAALQRMNDVELQSVGLDQVQIQLLRSGPRPAIPTANITRALWQNRWTCCVCRSPNLAVIAHHIVPWARSHDHSVDNLAVLCLEHHARAHSTGTLEQNLTPEKIRDAKKRWEVEVSRFDANAILNASRLENSHWLWFNHSRIFEAARRAGVEITNLPMFSFANRQGLISSNGALTDKQNGEAYLYAGGETAQLLQVTEQALKATLSRTAIFNISDDLDPGLINAVAEPGDLIFVQGRYVFKSLTGRRLGPGQASLVQRQANRVRISFTADLWEAVATSAWASWLRGTQRVSAILRIATKEKDGKWLHLKCTGIALATSFEGMSTRSYVWPSWSEQTEDEEEDDDWLSGDNYGLP
ncbi:HNH endonuclease [Defluviimonas sp. WL0002]|uniref:HNH endonuclease n=1 Tax=Albidovulum marisflavi TaxID=2984159 RepID=A0ABT2Z8M1_9RHOB|nr:HNH endonuclease signature motif containing protein [Defluviimonas sp. WL0002]MCV2867437.1 HNH endonuclease [Defluviimonas sp. WL0002]